jgi:hypothetical protein
MKKLLQELSSLGEEHHRDAVYLASVARCLKAGGLNTRCVNLAAQKLINDHVEMWEAVSEHSKSRGGIAKGADHYDNWTLTAAIKDAELEFGKTFEQVKGIYYAEKRMADSLAFEKLET